MLLVLIIQLHLWQNKSVCIHYLKIRITSGKAICTFCHLINHLPCIIMSYKYQLSSKYVNKKLHTPSNPIFFTWSTFCSKTSSLWGPEIQKVKISCQHSLNLFRTFSKTTIICIRSDLSIGHYQILCCRGTKEVFDR